MHIVSSMIRIHGLLLLLLLPAVQASAQTRLFAIFSGAGPCTNQGCPAGTMIDIDVDRGRINGTAPVTPGWRTSSAGVTPDGRYLVFDGYRSPAAHLDALDTSSYAVASFYVSQPGPGFGYAVHPTIPRVYFQRPADEQIYVVDANAGVRPWPVVTGQRPGVLQFVTGDGSRLVMERHLTNEVAVVDSDTAARLGVVSEAFGVVAVNADGTEIYSYGAASTRPLERRAVSTGAVLATTNLDPAGNVTLIRDPRSGHIWFASGGKVQVFDGSSLATIAELEFPFGMTPVRLAFDPDRPTAYLGWKTTSDADNLPAHFVALNTNTMAVEAEADIFVPRLGLISGLVLGPRPPHVEGLSAVVNGSAVALSWAIAAGRTATRLIVEAGSAPGMANLARFVLPPGETTLVVPNVPSGRYFVRVRPANWTGEGVASNEIAVTVQ